MKETANKFWRLFLVSIFILIGVATPINVTAETCTLGQAKLNVTTPFVRFTQNAKECKQRKKLSKKITFTVSGEEAISIESTDLRSGDDAESKRAFAIRNTLSYGLRPGDSVDSEITFQPSEFRSYSSTLVVTFGYGNESLGPYRECLVRTLGAEIIRKQEMLETFKQKGVDLSVPNEREKKLRSDFDQLKTKLVDERTKADQDKFRLPLEKIQALEELRKGLFCDKCHRSKTRIEKEDKEEFQVHLKKVKGNIEPASQKVIDETIKFYDDAIKAATEASDRANKQLDEATTKVTTDLLANETLKRQLIEAFNTSVARLDGYVSEARRRSDDAMKVWERKKQAREILNVSIEGECREE